LKVVTTGYFYRKFGQNSPVVRRVEPPRKTCGNDLTAL